MTSLGKMLFSKRAYEDIPFRIKFGISLLVFASVMFWILLQIPPPTGFVMDADWGHQLTGGYQILFGEHPFIDYHVTYGPLTFYASSWAQLISGNRIIGEILLVTLGFSVGYTILFHLMWKTGSRFGWALLLLAIALLMIPRLYKYYIILTPALSLLAFWYYIDQRRMYTKCLLGFTIAITGLFRPDFGVYVTLAVFVTILFFSTFTLKQRIIDCIQIGGFTFIGASPWLIWALLQGGLDDYFSDTLYSASHASGMSRILIGPDTRVVILYAFFLLLPVIAFIYVYSNRLLVGAHRTKIIGAIVLSLLVFMQALHRVDQSHLLQAITIHFVLGMFLIDQIIHGFNTRSMPWRLSSAVLGITFIIVGFFAVNLHTQRLRSLEPSQISHVFEYLPKYAVNRDAFLDFAATNEPNHPYLDAMMLIRACTDPQDRVLGLPLLTSFNYLVERPFGGGLMLLVPGFFTDLEGQEQMLSRMRTENVPVIVYAREWRLDNREDGIMSAFAPLIADYIEQEYVTAHEYGLFEIRVRDDFDQILGCVREQA